MAQRDRDLASQEELQSRRLEEQIQFMSIEHDKLKGD